MKRHAERDVYAYCPICRIPIPVLTVTIEVTGWLRKRADLLVNGDATNYVAHIWMHEQQQKAHR